MAQKLVLSFGAEHWALFRWQRKRLLLVKRFSPGAEGLGDLRQSLGQHRSALMHVVLDVAGEDFQDEQIPLLRAAERRIVIERRLAQRYGDARFAIAVSLGRASGERRNERLLLGSFPQGPVVPWLEALLQGPVTIATVVSTGLLAPALAAKLGSARGDSLLVSWNRAGLRQSLLERGRLRFSRLERPPAEGMSPAFVRREIERTVQFLENSRALPADRPPLAVTLLVPDEQCTAFEAALAHQQRLAFRVLGVGQAAKQLGLQPPPVEDPADLLYLHTAVLRPPAEQFLRAADRRPFLRWILRRALVATGASAFAASVAYAGFLWLERDRVRVETATVRQQISQLHSDEQRLRAQLPATPVNTEALKAVALEFRRIVARTAPPEVALLHLSAALDQAPEIELEALSWETSESFSQVLEVSARVQAGEQADHREVGGRIERFSKLLASGDWRISGSRMPFDAGPHAPLSVDFGARDALERTRFSITLARPPR